MSLYSPARLFQTEDGLLLFWLVVAEPLLSRLLGGILALAGSAGEGITPVNLAVSSLYLVSALGAVGVLLTRAHNTPPQEGSEPDVSTPSGYARMPMIFVLGVLFDSSGRSVGLPFGDYLFAVAMLAWGVSFFLQSKLPVLPDVLRRILISPAIIVLTSTFISFSERSFRGVDVRNALAAFGTPEWPLVPLGACVLLLGIGFFYLFFIFAPRQIASSGGTWSQWFARFCLYVIGMLLNIGPLKMLG